MALNASRVLKILSAISVRNMSLNVISIEQPQAYSIVGKNNWNQAFGYSGNWNVHTLEI
jgi:hypothetical protein